MTDGQLLLLVFTAFYLYECLRWVPARAVVWSHFGGKKGAELWRGALPLSLLRTRGGAFALLSPIPPIGAHLVTASWPCVPHETGLCVWDDASGAATHIPWSEVEVSADEAVLVLSAHHRVRCVHGWQAAAWAKLVQSWKDLPQQERVASFQAKAAELFNRTSLQNAARQVIDDTHSLRWRGMIIFFWTFGFLPYSYWRFTDEWPTLAAVIVLYLLMAWQAISVAILARGDSRLRLGRWSHILGAAFFPPSSIRVADWVCAMKAPEIHPLLASFEWSKKEDAEKEASRDLRLARWPLGDFQVRPWDGPEVTAVMSFLKSCEVELESLNQTPASGQGAEKYCPRCLATFSGQAAVCSDCKDMSLVDMASSSASTKAITPTPTPDPAL